MAYYSNRIQSLGLDKIKIIGSDTMKQLKENKEFVKFMEFEEEPWIPLTQTYGYLQMMEEWLTIKKTQKVCYSWL